MGDFAITSANHLKMLCNTFELNQIYDWLIKAFYSLPQIIKSFMDASN